MDTEELIFWHWFEFWNSIKDQREATDSSEHDTPPSPKWI